MKNFKRVQRCSTDGCDRVIGKLNPNKSGLCNIHYHQKAKKKRNAKRKWDLRYL